MAGKSTFRLGLPEDKPVEVYTVQLASGLIVVRTLDELKPHPKNTGADRG